MLKITRFILLFLFVALQPAFAADNAPSDASIRELLDVTQSKKLLDNSLSRIDELMRASMQQSLGDNTFTKEQQKIMDDMEVKMIALFKDEMSWDSLEPAFVDVYRKSFTQQEIDGMLKFYKSPAGQAVIAKMPLVMQNSMQMMQGKMSAMMPKLQKLQQETIEHLKKTR